MFKVQGPSSFSRPSKKVWSRHGQAASPISANGQHLVPEQPEPYNKDMLLQPWSSLMGTLIPPKTQISIAHSEHLISHFHSVGLIHFMNMGSKIDNNKLSLPFWEVRKMCVGRGGGVIAVVFSPHDDHLNQREKFLVKCMYHQSYNVKPWIIMLNSTPTSKKEVHYLFIISSSPSLPMSTQRWTSRPCWK